MKDKAKRCMQSVCILALSIENLVVYIKKKLIKLRKDNSKRYVGDVLSLALVILNFLIPKNRPSFSNDKKDVLTHFLNNIVYFYFIRQPKSKFGLMEFLRVPQFHLQFLIVNTPESPSNGIVSFKFTDFNISLKL
jgi:hypothetical protein